MRSVAICLLLLASPALLEGQLHGRVYDAQSDAVIGGVVLELAGTDLRQMARSDAEGKYSFGGLAGGDHCLRAVHPGYEPARLCVVMARGRALVLDLSLTPRPVPIQGIVAVALRTGGLNGDAAGDSLQTRFDEARLGMLGGTPAGTPIGDVVGGALALPPPPAQPDRRRPHVLHIWNAGTDRGKMMLDGAVLSAPLHMGSILPLLDPELLGPTRVHRGGDPPRHDGGTTQILEFTTRQAEHRRRFWIDANLLSTTGGFESAVPGRVGFIASARRVNEEIINRTITDRFGYTYHDGTARLDLQVGESTSIRATGLGTFEELRIPRDQGDDFAAWENLAFSLGGHTRKGAADHTANLFFSRGRAGLPVLSALGGHQEIALDRGSIAGESRWSVGGGALSIGAELEHLRHRRAFRSDEDAGTAGSAGCGSAATCEASGQVVSAHADATAALSDRLTARLGGRLRYSPHERRVTLLPRVSLSGAVTGAIVTLGAGSFSQPVLIQGDSAIRISTAVAHHVHLDVGHRRNGRLVTGGAYLRSGDPLQAGGGLRFTPGLEAGVGQQTAVGTFTATYLIERTPPASPDSHSLRQHAAITLAAAAKGWRGTVGLSYATGFPPTSIILGRPAESFLHAGPLPESTGESADRGARHLRLDGSFGGEWRVDGAGTTLRMMPYIRVMNALRQRESIFYFHDGEIDGAPQPLARLPVVPTFGIRVEF